MDYHLVISNEAKLDIKEAQDYYFSINEILSKRYVTDIVATIDKLLQNATHHQIRYKNIRISFATNFPYGIHYIINNNTIFVLRVFHTKRFFK